MQILFVTVDSTLVVSDTEIVAVVGVDKCELFALADSRANDCFLDVLSRRLFVDAHSAVLEAYLDGILFPFGNFSVVFDVEVEDVTAVIVMLKRDGRAVNEVAVCFDCGVC